MFKPVSIRILDDPKYLNWLKWRLLKYTQLCEHGIECRNCCWIWKGNVVRGYGKIRVYETKQQVHRISWSVFNNQEFPEGMLANHIRECPYKLCIQPAHVYPGDHCANIQDYVNSAKCGLALRKASNELANEIRNMHASGNFQYKELAAIFRICSSTISRIVQRKGVYANT